LLIKIILLLISSYYFWHGIYPLLTAKPCIKANNIRKLVVSLLIIELVIVLFALFLIFVALYGYTYAGLTIANGPFYILLFLSSLLILWFFYQKEIDSDSLKHGTCLLAISSEYAMLAVYDTLAEMKINYDKTLSGFEVVDRDVAVKITLSTRQICFSVTRPLDKMFLNQFCKIYQTVYKKQRYPVSKRFCCLSNALGLMALLCFFFTISDYAFVLSNIMAQSLDPNF